MQPPRVLAIAGSDSGGGAGLQADIKTITALGGYAATAVTAITVQDTAKVHAVHPLPPALVADQIRVVLNDIGADAIKTGMLGEADLITSIARVIAENAPDVPFVLDPVMVATSGDSLFPASALTALKTHLIPRATLLTPNLPEAATLTGLPVTTEAEMHTALAALKTCGARAVLLKGGHLTGDTLTDLLWDGTDIIPFPHPRLRHPGNGMGKFHGTGCTLASAIAFFLAARQPLRQAVSHALDFTQAAIRTATPLGQGATPLNHAWRAR